MSYVMVAMAGAGLLKSEVFDKQKEARDRKLAATTQSLSPWTGMQANPIKEADPMGSAIAFGATGAQIKNGMDQTALNKQIADRYSSGGGAYNPYGGGGSGMPDLNQGIWGNINNKPQYSVGSGNYGG